MSQIHKLILLVSLGAAQCADVYVKGDIISALNQSSAGWGDDLPQGLMTDFNETVKQLVVPALPLGSYEFKVKNGASWYPSVDNYLLQLSLSGPVTIYYSPASNAIRVASAPYLSTQRYQAAPLGDVYIRGSVVAADGWDANTEAGKMTWVSGSQYKWESGADALVVGDYEFKVRSDFAVPAWHGTGDNEGEAGPDNVPVSVTDPKMRVTITFEAYTKVITATAALSSAPTTITDTPTLSPSGVPTSATPTTIAPSGGPTTNTPSSAAPTQSPLESNTTKAPTSTPTGSPTGAPTGTATESPTGTATGAPTGIPVVYLRGEIINALTDSLSGWDTDLPEGLMSDLNSTVKQLVIPVLPLGYYNLKVVDGDTWYPEDNYMLWLSHSGPVTVFYSTETNMIWTAPDQAPFLPSMNHTTASWDPEKPYLTAPLGDVYVRGTVVGADGWDANTAAGKMTWTVNSSFYSWLSSAPLPVGDYVFKIRSTFTLPGWYGQGAYKEGEPAVAGPDDVTLTLTEEGTPTIFFNSLTKIITVNINGGPMLECVNPDGATEWDTCLGLYTREPGACGQGNDCWIGFQASLLAGKDGAPPCVISADSMGVFEDFASQGNDCWAVSSTGRTTTDVSSTGSSTIDVTTTGSTTTDDSENVSGASAVGPTVLLWVLCAVMVA